MRPLTSEPAPLEVGIVRAGERRHDSGRGKILSGTPERGCVEDQPQHVQTLRRTRFLQPFRDGVAATGFQHSRAPSAPGAFTGLLRFRISGSMFA
ncbi:MAG: hypothetical protein DME24_19490 [Verrucomicrobia bacterium]|nr:MAG: hypothetical protein DME24_19490 [Verrucomicrobiota bacterium]